MKKIILFTTALLLHFSCVHAQVTTLLTTEHLTAKAYTGPDMAQWKELVAEFWVTGYVGYPYLYEQTSQEFIEATGYFFEAPSATLIIIFDGSSPIAVSRSIIVSDLPESRWSSYDAFQCDKTKLLFIPDVLIKDCFHKYWLFPFLLNQHEEIARTKNCKIISFVRIEQNIKNEFEPIWRYGYQQIPGITFSALWKKSDTHQVGESKMAPWYKSIQ